MSAPQYIHVMPKNVILSKVAGIYYYMYVCTYLCERMILCIALGMKSTPTMVKVYLYANKSYLPSALEATVSATYLTSKGYAYLYALLYLIPYNICIYVCMYLGVPGEPRVATHALQLPLYLACRPKAPVKSSLCKGESYGCIYKCMYVCMNVCRLC